MSKSDTKSLILGAILVIAVTIVMVWSEKSTCDQQPEYKWSPLGCKEKK